SLGPSIQPISVEEPISGLQPGTTYHWLLYAYHPGGQIVYGKTLSFKTVSPPPPPTPPTASTGVASNLTQSSATLNGIVNPEGANTAYHFEYGATTGYGLTGPSANVGSGAVPESVTTNVFGLQSGTTYHFRLVASNSSGTGYGADRSFTTIPL